MRKLFIVRVTLVRVIGVACTICRIIRVVLVCVSVQLRLRMSLPGNFLLAAFGHRFLSPLILNGLVYVVYCLDVYNEGGVTIVLTG